MTFTQSFYTPIDRVADCRQTKGSRNIKTCLPHRPYLFGRHSSVVHFYIIKAIFKSYHTSTSTLSIYQNIEKNLYQEKCHSSVACSHKRFCLHELFLRCHNKFTCTNYGIAVEKISKEMKRISNEHEMTLNFIY